MRNVFREAGLFSGALAAAVPIAKCPICAAAAACVFGTLGIATIGFELWFLPVVAILLLLGMWGFWKSSRAHKNPMPLLLAIVAGGLILVGRLVELPWALWPGTALLLAAYVLDLAIKRNCATET